MKDIIIETNTSIIAIKMNITIEFSERDGVGSFWA